MKTTWKKLLDVNKEKHLDVRIIICVLCSEYALDE